MTNANAELPSIPPVEFVVECRQLSQCRWGFLLLGAGLAVQLVLMLWANFEFASLPKEEQAKRQNSREDPLIAMTATVLAAFPAAVLLGRNARSPRWRFAARGLVAAVGFDAVLTIAVFAATRGGRYAAGAEPLPIRMLAEASILMGWVEFWFMAVLVAEFALAAKAPWLVERTEHLGYLILGGGLMTIALFAWTLPRSGPIDAEDSVGLLLGTPLAIGTLVALVWTMRLISTAATLARFHAARCLAESAKPGLEPPPPNP